MITVKYKCKCMQDEGSFKMATRLANEDPEEFMERMGHALAFDHMQRNPLCQSEVMEYVKVPASGEGNMLGTSGQQ